MGSRDLTKIHEEYHSQKSQYDRFCTEVVKQITELLSSASVVPALPIQYRVKSWDSILDKFETKGDLLNRLSDLPDIAGIRIVLLFQRDINKVVEVVEATFEVLKKEVLEIDLVKVSSVMVRFIMRLPHQKNGLRSRP